jgi:hypothetical protein
MSERVIHERCPECELTLSGGACLMCGYQNPVTMLEAKIAQQAGEINQLTMERDQLLENNAWPVLQRVKDQANTIKRLAEALREARTNVAYAYQPDNRGDHCRNICRDCALKNTLDDLDAALSPQVTP